MKFTFKIQKYQTEAVDALVRCFANDSVATNFEQIFTTYSAGTVRKVL